MSLSANVRPCRGGWTGWTGGAGASPDDRAHREGVSCSDDGRRPAGTGGGGILPPPAVRTAPRQPAARWPAPPSTSRDGGRARGASSPKSPRGVGGVRARDQQCRACGRRPHPEPRTGPLISTDEARRGRSGALVRIAERGDTTVVTVPTPSPAAVRPRWHFSIRTSSTILATFIRQSQPAVRTCAGHADDPAVPAVVLRRRRGRSPGAVDVRLRRGDPSCRAPSAGVSDAGRLRPAGGPRPVPATRPASFPPPARRSAARPAPRAARRPSSRSPRPTRPTPGGEARIAVDQFGDPGVDGLRGDDAGGPCLPRTLTTCPGCPGTRAPAPTSPDDRPRAGPPQGSCAASSDTSREVYGLLAAPLGPATAATRRP